MARKEDEVENLERGTVVEKVSAYDVVSGKTVYALRLECENDHACHDTVVVPEAMYKEAVIRGFGRDTVVEYGTILRIVRPDTTPKGPCDKCLGSRVFCYQHGVAVPCPNGSEVGCPNTGHHRCTACVSGAT